MTCANSPFWFPFTRVEFSCESNTALPFARGTNSLSDVDDAVISRRFGSLLSGVAVYAWEQSKGVLLFLLRRHFCRLELKTQWVGHMERWLCEKESTLRFIPRGFFSPSNCRSNLPILAVLARVVASVRSISCLRSLDDWPVEWERFWSFCFSFFAVRALRSSRAIFLGSWSTSEKIYIRDTGRCCLMKNSYQR